MYASSHASTTLQKYLHWPSTVKTKKTPTASCETDAISGARVRTSAEWLAIIKEKEMKKQEERKRRKRKEVATGKNRRGNKRKRSAKEKNGSRRRQNTEDRKR